MGLKIDFSNLGKVMNDRYMKLVFDNHPTQVLVGGSNSGKSYGVAQKVIYKMLAVDSNNKPENHRFLVCRKVKKDVRHSCYDLLKSTIRNFGLDDLFTYNDTETMIKCILNDSDAIGVGLDDPQKLKSILDPTDFWIEEADQCTEEDYNMMHLRLRGNTSFVKQETLSMNPVWVEHWAKRKFFDKTDPTVLTDKSTYKDNRFLDKQTIDKLLAITDPYYKMVYVDGEWGVFGKRVFSDYIIEDFDYMEDDMENVFTGMDFGYTHASAIERGGFIDGDIYVFDELYLKEATNTQFIQAAQEQWGNAGHYFRIIADRSEPDRIAEWNAAGFHVEPALQGHGSLQYGIDYLRAHRIHIHKTKCLNLAREIQTYHRKLDKFGNETDFFEEKNDDTISCIRFGTESFWHDDAAGQGFVADYNGFDFMNYLGL